MGRAGSYAAGIVGTGIGGLATTVTGDLINQMVQGSQRDTLGNTVYSSSADWENAKHSTTAVLKDAYQNSAEAQGKADIAAYNNILANEVEQGFQSAESNLDGYGQDKRGTGQG